ncbi:MAG: hypothetical protein ACKOI2_05375 [Actinomycetota bacterium]
MSTIKLLDSDGQELTIGDVEVFTELVTEFCKTWASDLPTPEDLIDPPDARGLEYFVLGFVWQGLCESAELRARDGDQPIVWGLFREGALAGAKFPYFKGGYAADVAWRRQRIALMIDYPLAELNCPEIVAEEMEYRERRNRFFEDRGWLVFRINPKSERRDEQIARIARIVRQTETGRGHAS